MPSVLARDKGRDRALAGSYSSQVREYIARGAARRYGPLEPSVTSLVRRNIRRNFGVLLAPETVSSRLAHYKEIYNTAASLLGLYLRPAPPGRLRGSCSRAVGRLRRRDGQAAST
jgi:hypothetical protein